MECDLERLKQMFSKMAEDGLDTSKPLKWGFFFVASNKDNLMAVYNELKDHTYVLEELREDEEDKDVWILHVSKIDTLTCEKLHRRNLSFNELAGSMAVESYDGWDVDAKSIPG
jgi:hypothetical protein